MIGNGGENTHGIVNQQISLSYLFLLSNNIQWNRNIGGSVFLEFYSALKNINNQPIMIKIMRYNEENTTSIENQQTKNSCILPW